MIILYNGQTLEGSSTPVNFVWMRLGIDITGCASAVMWMSALLPSPHRARPSPAVRTVPADAPSLTRPPPRVIPRRRAPLHVSIGAASPAADAPSIAARPPNSRHFSAPFAPFFMLCTGDFPTSRGSFPAGSRRGRDRGPSGASAEPQQ